MKKAGSSEGSKSPSKESASFNAKTQPSVLADRSGAIPPEAVFIATSVAATLLKMGIQIGIAKLIASKAKKNFVKKSTADNEQISKEVMGEYADAKQFSDNNPPKKISGKHSIEDDAKAVNPMFDESIAHTATNCVLCTATYDLRRRGYDVTAKMCKTGSMVDSIIESVYKGKTKAIITSKAKNWDEVLDAGKYSIPDGSRGFFSINSSKIGMGHCMAFEVKDGKFRIIDSQCANTNVDIKADKFKLFDPNRTLIVRTDHLSVNMKNVGLTSAELKDGWKTKVTKSNKQTVKTDGYKQYIEQYKKDHPDTKLSDDEIGKNYSPLK